MWIFRISFFIFEKLFLSNANKNGRNMNLCPIDGETDLFWKSFLSLYQESFPDYERRPLSDLTRLLEMQKSRYRLLAILEDDRFVGFFGLWSFDRYVYVEHFAVASENRGTGVGTNALRMLQESENLPFVLEVEPPIDEQTRRRVSFYERMGFCLSDVYYWQPPYSSGLDGLELRLMFYRQNEITEIQDIVHDIHAVVYNLS